MDAINSRRSIRRFSDREIPHDIICKIIESGIKAPSSKNRQPWKFMVIQGQAKEEMLRAFRAGIQREKSGRAMLPESSRHLRGAEYTVQNHGTGAGGHICPESPGKRAVCSPE